MCREVGERTAPDLEAWSHTDILIEFCHQRAGKKHDGRSILQDVQPGCTSPGFTSPGMGQPQWVAKELIPAWLGVPTPLFPC